MIGNISGVNREQFLAALIWLGLASFGFVYNAFTEWAERRGYAEGYMSLIVAAGCGVTLLGVTLLDLVLPNWNAGLISLTAFAASGAPMILGSVVRYARSRRQDLTRMLADIRISRP